MRLSPGPADRAGRCLEGAVDQRGDPGGGVRRAEAFALQGTIDVDVEQRDDERRGPVGGHRLRRQLAAIARILAREGTETSSSRSPEEFAGFLAEDAKLWARLVKDSGAKAD